MSTTLVPICLAAVATSIERSKSTQSWLKGWALWLIFFYSLSNIPGAVHVLFGTVMLSSVLFIGTLDSTVVCQFITALELERVENLGAGFKRSK